MFWFKRKNNKLDFKDDELIGSDIPKRPLKVGYKLSVPEGRVCYLCYHDKVYYSFRPGDYVLDNNSIPKLLEKQQKKSFFSSKKDAQKQKVTKFNADFYFVKEHESRRLEFAYHWKNFAFADKSKEIFDVQLVVYYEIEDTRKFLDGILDEVAIIEQGQALNLLTSWLKDDGKQYIYMHPLANIVARFDEAYTTEMANYLHKEYTKIGINITGIEIGFGGKRQYEPTNIVLPSIEQLQRDNPQLNASNLPKVEIEQPIGDTAVAELPTEVEVKNDDEIIYCPFCQAKAISGAVFCHRCGKRLR